MHTDGKASPLATQEKSAHPSHVLEQAEFIFSRNLWAVTLCGPVPGSSTEGCTAPAHLIVTSRRESGEPDHLGLGRQAYRRWLTFHRRWDLGNAAAPGDLGSAGRGRCHRLERITADRG